MADNVEQEPVYPALWMAAYKGQTDFVNELLRPGVDIEAANLPLGNSSCTSLWIAAQNGKLEIVKLLHEHGADIEAKRLDGFNPLSIATKVGHVDVVQYLLKARSPLYPTNMCDIPAVWGVAQMGEMKVV